MFNHGFGRDGFTVGQSQPYTKKRNQLASQQELAAMVESGATLKEIQEAFGYSSVQNAGKAVRACGLFIKKRSKRGNS